VVLHRDETAMGTVTLSGTAPAGSSATFPVTLASSGVSSPTEVTLNAVYQNTRQSFVIRLEPLR
jgi:hypothetical protein